MSKIPSSIAALAALGLLTLPASGQTVAGPCGDTVVVQRDDSLSSIAERCDVPEGRLIRLNPRIEGSRDLRVGMELRTRRDGETTAGSVLDRLGSVAGETADALSGIARDLESSAKGFLERNPEIGRRLERFEDRLRGSGTASISGTVTAARVDTGSGEALAVTAQGLPPDTPIALGIGRPQAAYEIVEQVRTKADGTLERNVPIPDWAARMSRITVVVAAENGEWSIRSQPVRLEGQKL